ncbi:MAG: hypothetical protein ACK5RG_13305 [Cyclobacteriaceae bacterium]|nr:hypothetical protein [Flammeovirgaceae bacterium]
MEIKFISNLAMSLLKYINRVQLIHSLISREATGSSEEFAKKLGISKSMLMIDLQELRELGAELEFCHVKGSYRYKRPFQFIIGKEKNSLKGGRKIMISLPVQ